MAPAGPTPPHPQISLDTSYLCPCTLLSRWLEWPLSAATSTAAPHTAFPILGTPLETEDTSSPPRPPAKGSDHLVYMNCPYEGRKARPGSRPPTPSRVPSTTARPDKSSLRKPDKITLSHFLFS